MPDGRWWTTYFQHERAQLMRRGRERERLLFVFFEGEGGAVRRAEVTDAFKASATDDDLRAAWARAVALGAGGVPDPDAY